jgi:hypothetical protein
MVLVYSLEARIAITSASQSGLLSALLQDPSRSLLRQKERGDARTRSCIPQMRGLAIWQGTSSPAPLKSVRTETVESLCSWFAGGLQLVS